MAGRTAELTVAGETYRVITTADEQELQRLAAMVEAKLSGLWQPGRPVSTRAMVLAAVSLAHDVTEQQERADAVARRARQALTGLLGRVDAALHEAESIAPGREGRRRPLATDGPQIPAAEAVGPEREGRSRCRSRSSAPPPPRRPFQSEAAPRARDGDGASDDG